MTRLNRLFILSVFTLLTVGARADIDPKATYTDKEGMEVSDWESFTAEAPLHVRFTSNAFDTASGTSIEWSIKNKRTESSVTRYEADTEYDFTEAGVHLITVNEMVGEEIVNTSSIEITIAESHLEMPNAFSPNDDGVNDIYGAKGISPDSPESSHYKSIVSFHAWIFNRWGQKLFEWTDISKGWDGKYNGSPVKDGVYYVLVKARGADGVEYNIRRDVNLIRKFNTETSGTGGSDE